MNQNDVAQVNRLVLQIERESKPLCEKLMHMTVKRTPQPDELAHSIVYVNDNKQDAWLIHRINGGGEPIDDRLYLATGAGMVIQFRRRVCTLRHFWVRDLLVPGSGQGLRNFDALSTFELKFVLKRIEDLCSSRRYATSKKREPVPTL